MSGLQLIGFSKKQIETLIEELAGSVLDSLNAFEYKGGKDCSSNPKYPAASAGHVYIVSVAGKIGGASGIEVESGDLLVCKTDGSAEGTQVAVGANWDIVQSNLVVGAAGEAGKVLSATDPTTSDSRTPKLHVTSHKTGGSDALAPSDIGAATSAALASEISARESAINIINLGQDWSNGERLFGFTAQNSAGKKMEVKLGTTAAPDEGNQPIAVFSRVLKTPESAFSGDGAGNLAAVRFHTTAVAGSQGQAIGLAASATTFSNSEVEGGHSLADGIGLYGLGVSKGESTRTGMGLFANGRTETSIGRATGIEVAVDNESETEDSYTGTFPRTKAVHMHGTGLKRSAIGLFVSDKGIGVHTAIAAQTGALISSAFIRDDSKAPWSHLIKGEHSEAAVAIASGAGSLVIGIEKPALAATLLEVNGGGETHDPLVNFKVTGGKAIRVRLAENGGTGQVNAFVAGGTNSFVTGTVASDSGIGYGPGTTFHIGANGKTSMLRLTEAGIGFYGTAAQAKQEVTGSRGGNAALASLLEKLATIGMITNGTTA